MKKYRVEVRAGGKEGQNHWWRIRAKNGRILLTSEMYSSSSNAKKAANKFEKDLKN